MPTSISRRERANLQIASVITWATAGISCRQRRLHNTRQFRQYDMVRPRTRGDAAASPSCSGTATDRGNRGEATSAAKVIERAKFTLCGPEWHSPKHEPARFEVPSVASYVCDWQVVMGARFKVFLGLGKSVRDHCALAERKDKPWMIELQRCDESGDDLGDERVTLAIQGPTAYCDGASGGAKHFSRRGVWPRQGELPALVSGWYRCMLKVGGEEHGRWASNGVGTIGRVVDPAGSEDMLTKKGLDAIRKARNLLLRLVPDRERIDALRSAGRGTFAAVHDGWTLEVAIKKWGSESEEHERALLECFGEMVTTLVQDVRAGGQVNQSLVFEGSEMDSRVWNERSRAWNTILIALRVHELCMPYPEQNGESLSTFRVYAPWDQRRLLHNSLRIVAPKQGPAREEARNRLLDTNEPFSLPSLRHAPPPIAEQSDQWIYLRSALAVLDRPWLVSMASFTFVVIAGVAFYNKSIHVHSLVGLALLLSQTQLVTYLSHVHDAWENVHMAHKESPFSTLELHGMCIEDALDGAKKAADSLRVGSELSGLYNQTERLFHEVDRLRNEYNALICTVVLVLCTILVTAWFSQSVASGDMTIIVPDLVAIAMVYANVFLMYWIGSSFVRDAGTLFPLMLRTIINDFNLNVVDLQETITGEMAKDAESCRRAMERLMWIRHAFDCNMACLKSVADQIGTTGLTMGQINLTQMITAQVALTAPMYLLKNESTRDGARFMYQSATETSLSADRIRYWSSEFTSVASGRVLTNWDSCYFLCTVVVKLSAMVCAYCWMKSRMKLKPPTISGGGSVRMGTDALVILPRQYLETTWQGTLANRSRYFKLIQASLLLSNFIIIMLDQGPSPLQ